MQKIYAKSEVKKLKENNKSRNNTVTNSKEPKDRDSGYKDAIPGINTPGIELPAFNPPVPNRAWTAMREGFDKDELSPEEVRNLERGTNSAL